jgi:hypothetical protein
MDTTFHSARARDFYYEIINTPVSNKSFTFDGHCSALAGLEEYYFYNQIGYSTDPNDVYTKISSLSNQVDKAVSEGKKETKLKSGTRHLKGEAAEKQTGNLIQGACILANALGIDTKSFLETKSIKAVVPGGLSTSAGKDEDGKTCCSLNFCVKTIASADKFIKKATFKESDFTTSPTPDDIAKVHACDTAVSKLASFIKSKFGEDGAKIEARVKKACASCNKKKISDAAEDLNEKSSANVSKVVEIAKDLRAACDDFVKEFNNSADALIESKTED